MSNGVETGDQCRVVAVLEIELLVQAHHRCSSTSWKSFEGAALPRPRTKRRVEVHVNVDEAGHHQLAAGVDDPVRPTRDLAARRDGEDLVTLAQYRVVGKNTVGLAQCDDRAVGNEQPLCHAGLPAGAAARRFSRSHDSWSDTRRRLPA